MEGLEGKQVEGSNSINWEETFNLYANVIASDNDALKVRATIELAKNSVRAPEDILARTVPIVLELLEISSWQLEPLVKRASAYCLKCIAARGEGRLADVIGRSGAIPVMLRLLPDSEEGLQKDLLKALRNVVTFWSPNRLILANNDGPGIVVAMLNSCTDGVRLILLEILGALALMREVRKFLWNCRSIHHLVEAARSGSLISRTRAAQAVGLLGLVKKARRTLVDAGAVMVLVDLLKEGDTQTKLVAGNALGVISSHVDYIRLTTEAGVVPLYAELLEGSDPIGKEIAEDVFCVLAVYEENAVVIVEHLVRILRGENNGATAAAADIIWDLSSYNHSLPIVRDSGAIQILVELLKDEDVDVKEKVTGAIAQLSLNESDRAVLADCGAIPLLLTMLEDESDEARDNAAEALVNFSGDPLLGDRLSSILESPSFQNMRDRIMQMHSRMEMSLRQIGTEQLTWNPGN